MQICVLGAGLAGVTAAQALVRDGHQVSVIDRAAAPAQETSFANAGLISPGHAFSWASPGAPVTLLKSLFDRQQALRIRPRPDAALLRWGWRFMRNCQADAWARNSLKLMRLATYAQQALDAVVDDTGIEFVHTRGGLIYLYATDSALADALSTLNLLREAQIEAHVLTPDAVVRLEPALATRAARVAGAIHCPTDASGDAHQFTVELAAWCERQGVAFHFNETVRDWRLAGERIEAVRTDRGEHRADAFVLALGSYSPLIARPLGLKLPIYPVRGNSVSFPIGPEHAPPMLAGIDDASLTAWSRLGPVLRLTTTAEFSGYANQQSPRDVALLVARAQALFPDGADFSRPTPWTGLRPMTPEGPPLVGQAGPANLWLNTGHGAMGWTTATGTARILADLIAGRRPEHPLPLPRL
ncbi:D-amino acid dehydrogenase [Denitromonas iodatirespirans]|uniref:D-amino acid dehydrogenase n=1 Tax=Denitromonas iodatirespirans TaxID=2795389 RepID=A0A944DK00_DENI1|nr:D-amino acid dehydrogenase [Denitromonas iodatirespirans]MBT0960199.1 D-amino acid dehydrogenase [Denitromonas iodatirespirans]